MSISMINNTTSYLTHCYDWDITRINRFPRGKKDIFEKEGVTAIFFDQVEFFRRVWGLTPQNISIWEEVLAFYLPHGLSFRVDLPVTAVENSVFSSIKKNAKYIYSSYLVCLYLDNNKVLGNAANLSEEISFLPVTPINIGEYSQIYLRCFQDNYTFCFDAWHNINALIGLKKWHPYLIYYKNQIAGGGSFFHHGDTALFCSGSIMPEFRHLGLHQALIKYRLRECLRLGVTQVSAYAQIDSISLSNLLKLGFEKKHAWNTFRYNTSCLMSQ
ncbi:MAG: hypothetical protein QNK11_08690 [Legionella sp.]|nr:hypothetical protein [Legionella sp.]